MKKETKKVGKKEVKKEEKVERTIRTEKVSRSAEQIKAFDIQLNRVLGAVGGIKKMLNDSRNGEELLIQLSALTSIVSSAKLLILKEMVETEVQQKLQNKEVVDYDTLLLDIKKYL